jgi:hypothetical protein
VKRWVAAVVAVLFLSTATLHVFAHVGDADGACAVCHVQQAGVVLSPVPVVAAAPTLETALPEPAAPRAAAARAVAGSARAPPSLPA